MSYLKQTVLLAVINLLVVFQSQASQTTSFSEAQTALAQQQMQHQMLVSKVKFIAEGNIYKINDITAANNIAVGYVDAELHSFSANEQRKITYINKQKLPNTNHISYAELSPDGKYLYVQARNSNYQSQLLVMSFNESEQLWQSVANYSAFNNFSISNENFKMSENGEFGLFYSSYSNWLIILKRNAQDGTLSVFQSFNGNENWPYHTRNVSISDNGLLIVSGESAYWNTSTPLVMFKLNAAADSFTELAHITGDPEGYSTITNLVYDQQNQRLYYVDNNYIHVYQLDLESGKLSLTFRERSYVVFNHYLYSNTPLSLVGDKLLIQQYHNFAYLYDFNDGATPSFTLAETISTPLQISSLRYGTDLAWYKADSDLQLLEIGEHKANVSIVSSLKDGEQNLPKVTDASYQISIDNKGLIVLFKSDGIYTIKMDGSSNQAESITSWSSLGYASEKPDLTLLSVVNNQLLFTQRYYDAEQGWNKHSLLMLNIDDDYIISAKQLSLQLNGMSIDYEYSDTFNNIDVQNGILGLKLSSGSYGFFKLENEERLQFIDTVDASLLGNSDYYGNNPLYFINGKALVWNNNTKRLYWLNINVEVGDVDVIASHDLSADLPNTSSLYVNDNNLYFISQDMVNSYLVTEDNSVTALSYSFITNISGQMLKFISPDFVIGYFGNHRLNYYGVDRLTGAWKLLNSVQADDFGLDSFGYHNYNTYFSQQILIANSQLDHAYGLAIGDIYTSPIQRKSFAPLLVNQGVPVEFNIADHVFDADQDELLSFSSENLATNTTLTDTGVLSVETQFSAEGQMSIHVVDSHDMTLDMQLVYIQNAAPVIDDIPTYWVNPNDNIAIDLNDYTTDPEQHAFAFSGNDENILTIKSNGLITGLLPDSGAVNLIGSVMDELGAKTEFSINIQVNSAPIATSALSGISVTEGDVVNQSFMTKFTDNDGHQLTFSAQGLPNGLTLSERGELAGSSHSLGKTTALITVTDTMGLSASVAITINIMALPTQEQSSGGSFGYLLLLLPLMLRKRVI
jgi:6-phosphogluconolactonase (cycloisomerase 2 family)